MKHYASYALSVLLSLITLAGFSQTNSHKPKQFDSFPSEINCTELELSKVFNTAQGQDITLAFSDNFIFSGKVTSNIVRYNNLQTAIITSPAYANTIFSISRITNADRSVSYIGRIINKNYFDGFELKRNTTGNYQLKKMQNDLVIQDCTRQ